MILVLQVRNSCSIFSCGEWLLEGVLGGRCELVLQVVKGFFKKILEEKIRHKTEIFAFLNYALIV